MTAWEILRPSGQRGWGGRFSAVRGNSVPQAGQRSRLGATSAPHWRQRVEITGPPGALVAMR